MTAHDRRRGRPAKHAGGEAAFQQQVEQLAAFYGWRTYHTHDSRRSTPGFPDLVMVRGPELVFAELKTNTGRTTPEQDAWLAELELVASGLRALRSLVPDGAPLVPAATVDVYVWRPADWDTLQRRLARGRNLVPALNPPASAVDPSRDPRHPAYDPLLDPDPDVAS